jgi:hypothetical protein
MESAPTAPTVEPSLGKEEKEMPARKSLIQAAGAIALFLAAAGVALQLCLAQGPATFNEREVKSTGSVTDDPKSDIWTLDFRFKDPRLIKVNIPGRGTRVCWYLWFQVVNRTKEPRPFIPEFELVTLDYPGAYTDEVLTTAEEAIRKIEDPTGYQEIKNTVTISKNPIPVSLAPDKAFPQAVTGVAIWDGTAADPKARTEKTRDLSDSQRFTIFVGGLSNGWVKVDPLSKGKADQPVIRRKTLQLNFKRAGDRYNLDSRDITFEPPAEWIYRSMRLPQLPALPGKDGKEGKTGALRTPAPDLDHYLQPVIHQGNDNGT